MLLTVLLVVSVTAYPYDDVREFLPNSFLASQGIRLPKPIHREDNLEKRHIQSHSPKEEQPNTPYLQYNTNIYSGLSQPPVRQLPAHRQQRPVYQPYRQQIINQYSQSGVQYPRNGVQYPRTEAQYPRTEVQYPVNGVQYPRNGVQYPRTEVLINPQRPLVAESDTLYEEDSSEDTDTSGEISQETEAEQSTEHPYEHLLQGNFKLSDLSMDQLGVFLEDEEAVTQLSDCFIDVEDCPSASAVRLISQIQSLGMGGKCEECTEEEQEKVEELVYSFIAKFSEKYPLLWFRLLPRLGYLMVSSSF